MKFTENIIRFFLITLSVSLSISIAEAIIGYTTNISPYDFFLHTTKDWPGNWFNEIHVVPSSTLGYEMKPGVGTNSLGMHDKERMRAKRVNTYRIIIVGDSITVCSRYPQFLEELYSKIYQEKIEVWNCAVAGYNLIQECTALQEKWLKFNPDMVIIGFCCNDFDTTPLITKIDGQLIGLFPNHMNIKLNPFLLKYSALYRLIMKNVFIYQSKKNNNIAFYNRAASALERTKKILDSKKIPLLLLILPQPVEYQKNTQEDAFNRIKKIATELQIATLDLIPYIEQFNPYELRLEPNDTLHLNLIGGKIIADAIADYLNKTNLSSLATSSSQSP
jgi:lysophospholipase L1-like esterase